jgi:hypothetical protein
VVTQRSHMWTKPATDEILSVMRCQENIIRLGKLVKERYCEAFVGPGYSQQSRSRACADGDVWIADESFDC